MNQSIVCNYFYKSQDNFFYNVCRGNIAVSESIDKSLTGLFSFRSFWIVIGFKEMKGLQICGVRKN